MKQRINKNAINQLRAFNKFLELLVAVSSIVRSLKWNAKMKSSDPMAQIKIPKPLCILLKIKKTPFVRILTAADIVYFADIRYT